LEVKLIPILRLDDHEFDPTIDPRQFIPAGRRKAAGYARPDSVPQQVAIAWAERRHNQSVGVWQGFENLIASYQEQGLPVTYTPTALPALSFTPVPAE
jgi:hypothetical protein